MSLLNSVILLIAFIYLLFIFPPGALLVVVVWVYLQFIRKPRIASATKDSDSAAR
ncbi:MAG: hypothetical protein ABSE80_06525 [Halobacteriota archaeon]|jgi:hypothetical protein